MQYCILVQDKCCALFLLPFPEIYSLQVGSDGCIFVWKLPALLSSKMLQRSKRISSEFPQDSINIPVAFNQIKSNQFDLLQKDSSKEEPTNGNVRHWSSDKLYQDGTSLEKTGFRFSVSRLPKWAQHQVTDNSVPVENSNSSKVEHLRLSFCFVVNINFWTKRIILFKSSWKKLY